MPIARILNNTIEYLPQSTATVSNYNLNEELYLEDGFIEISQELIDSINQGKLKIENNQIIDNPEYETKKAQDQEVWFKSNFIQTNIGWLRIQTVKGDLLSLMNSYEIFTRVNQGLPAQYLLTYREPDYTQDFKPEYFESLQQWNSAMTYAEFMLVFNQVAMAYMNSFKGN